MHTESWWKNLLEKLLFRKQGRVWRVAIQKGLKENNNMTIEGEWIQLRIVPSCGLSVGILTSFRWR
jgi:hypothetical protein